MSFVESPFAFQRLDRRIGAGKKPPLARLLGSPGGRRGLAVLAVLVLCVLLAFQPSYAAETAADARSDPPTPIVLAAGAAGSLVSATNCAQLIDLFGVVGYDLPRVRDGRGMVPPLWLERLPADWLYATTGDRRKRLFLQILLPLVEQANREILADRRRLRRLALAQRPDPSDRAWLARLAERYRASPDDLDGLLERVDVIPPSLALGQAALESGWGASRFAIEGNALFGQWTWAENAGLTPTAADAGQRHAVKTFPHLLDSVSAYMHNLNRQRAYAEFRRQRADFRLLGLPVTGAGLASNLTRYSVEREAYVTKVTAVMRQNDLEAFDAVMAID